MPPKNRRKGYLIVAAVAGVLAAHRRRVPPLDGRPGEHRRRPGERRRGAGRSSRRRARHEGLHQGEPAREAGRSARRDRRRGLRGAREAGRGRAGDGRGAGQGGRRAGAGGRGDVQRRARERAGHGHRVVGRRRERRGAGRGGQGVARPRAGQRPQGADSIWTAPRSCAPPTPCLRRCSTTPRPHSTRRRPRSRQARAQLAFAEQARATAAAQVERGAGQAQPEYAGRRADRRVARSGSAGPCKVRRAPRHTLDLAKLQLSYTRVTRPADGIASRLTVHPGQLVAVGQPVIQLVPTLTYVVANFKETQVGEMRPGQTRRDPGGRLRQPQVQGQGREHLRRDRGELLAAPRRQRDRATS